MTVLSNQSNSQLLKITVPFVYEAMVLLPRKKKPCVIAIKDSVEVSIKSVCVSTMPIAMIIGDTQLRWDGEHLWDYAYKSKREGYSPVDFSEVKANTENGGATYSYSTQNAAAPFNNFWRNTANTMMKKHRIKECAMLRRLDDSVVKLKADCEYKSWLDDNRQDVINDAIAIAASLLFIDGKLFETVREPCYEITTFGMGKNHGGTGLFIEQPSVHSASHFFNAMQYTDACAHANNVAAARGDDKSIPVTTNCGNIILVLIPEAVKYGPRQLAA